MKVLNKITNIVASLLIVVMQFVFLLPTPQAYAYTAYSNPAIVPLGTVSNFAALASQTITAAAATVLNNGDLGTNLDCTDFAVPCAAPHAFGTINNGSIQYRNTAATTGQTDATAAVTNIGLRSVDQSITSQLGGLTLGQGVYEVGADTTNLIGDLTLDGNADSVFIFHLTSTLITNTGSRVRLTGGAQACHVFWMVDSSATFNGTTQMVGTVLAYASVTFPAGGATLDGRAIARTAAITFGDTTVNNSSCVAAASSSQTSSSGGSSSSGIAPCIADTITTVPIIIGSNRISPTSISLNWGPYAGINTFNVEYGLTSGSRPYNISVTGFTAIINGLPANQPIWAQVAATNNCAIGTYGESKLVGGPGLPNTGFAPRQSKLPWYVSAGIFVAISALSISIQRKHRSS